LQKFTKSKLVYEENGIINSIIYTRRKDEAFVYTLCR